MKDLNNRVAVVTGGASGIGRGTAMALAERGVKLVIADLNGDGAIQAASEIAADGGEALGLRCDVAEEAAMDELRDAALGRFGRVDIVMNNVGIISVGLPEQIPVEDWRRDFEVNLFSVVRSNRAFLPLFLEKGEGHIVNTASFAGLYTYAFDRMPYAAAKAALIQVSEGLALYLRPKGIGVTCLCPGPVMTNIAKSVRLVGQPTQMRGPGAEFPLLDAASVGEMVVEAILANRFMLPTDEQVTARLVRRASDWDGAIQDQIDHPHLINLNPR
jgi:NAD(P)-dependent dehydrogenase (short-subunit alcohol dehydrogenase family)